MFTRTSALTAVLAAAALAGVAPAAASAAPPEHAKVSDTSTPPVVTGRTDGDSNGRKN